MKPISSNYDKQVDIGKQLFLAYDQDLLIGKYRLAADADYMYLIYLHTPCRIHRKTGSIEEQQTGQWMECRSYNTVMTIYDLLCYHEGKTAPVLRNEWCPVSSFTVTGSLGGGLFTTKYAALFDKDAGRLRKACLQAGGSILPSMAGADITCRFSVTSFFPVLFQFWSSDDEFPPKISLLWDRGSMEFLHFETTFFLQGDLLERLYRSFQSEASSLTGVFS